MLKIVIVAYIQWKVYISLGLIQAEVIKSATK